LPWSKIGYERIEAMYTDIILKIGKKKFENSHLPKQEILYRAEVLRRDFTKRQLKIISMIQSLSYYIGKERAIIPKMQDWEIAGISKIKIRSELTRLMELDVIDWNEEDNSFALKDAREWKVKFHSGYNNERARELFILNLKDSGVYSEE
jgi:hypothetical protein